MSVLGQHKLYDFRQQSWQEVQEALRSLINAKEVLVGKGPEFKKMYQYIEPVDLCAKKEMAGTLDLIDKEILLFLDAELIKEFLANPDDGEIRSVLSVEFALMAAATHSVQGIHPYSKDELALILKGEGSFYTDLIFLYTLRGLITTGTDVEVAKLLLRSLPRVRSASEDIQKQYFWTDAFIFSLILHTAWNFFGLFDRPDKQFLLQHYFYQAIVVGVPVRLWLQDFLNNQDDAAMLGISQEFVGDLQKNYESIPNNSEDNDGRRLAEVLTQGLLRANNEAVDILGLQKFIDEMYRGQDDGEVFASWLREAVTITLHLKKGDIVQLTD